MYSSSSFFAGRHGATNPHPITNTGCEHLAFANKAVIQPPKKEESISPYRVYKYMIDSRDRNTDKDPSPSQYELFLTEDIQDIAYVKLNTIDVPFSRYLIHGNNNTLFVSETPPALVDDKYVYSNITAVVIDQGNYTETTMVTELAARLNGSCRGTFTVTYNAKKDNFIIQSDLTDKATNAPIVFNLLFNDTEQPYGPQSLERVARVQNGSIVRDSQGNIIYDTVRVGDTTVPYKKNTPAKVLGFANQTYRAAITGTVSGASGQSTLTGTGTQFTKELTTGRVLRCVVYDNAGTPTLISAEVASIQSDTSLTLTATLATTLTEAIAYHGTLQPPFRRNFVQDRYIVLRIDRVELNHSLTTIIDKSFAIINNNDCKLSNDYVSDIVKWFDPALSGLKRIKVSFYDYDGNLYDFQNQDHRMELDFGSLKYTRAFSE
jgi:hypothetical protein